MGRLRRRVFGHVAIMRRRSRPTQPSPWERGDSVAASFGWFVRRPKAESVQPCVTSCVGRLHRHLPMHLSGRAYIHARSSGGCVRKRPLRRGEVGSGSEAGLRSAHPWPIARLTARVRRAVLPRQRRGSATAPQAVGRSLPLLRGSRSNRRADTGVPHNAARRISCDTPARNLAMDTSGPGSGRLRVVSSANVSTKLCIH
jgi:hypothetical protein